MPVSKQTLSRYQIINTCLQSKVKKYWSVTDLLEKLSDNDIQISERTLKEDFFNMRTDYRLGYLAPITWCNTNRGYYYNDRTYSINPMSLTHEEIETLHVAVDLLKPYERLSLFQEFTETIQKISRQVNQTLACTKEEMIPLIYCEQHCDDEEIEILEQLLEATRKQYAVELLLRRNSGKVDKVIFHPYHLQQVFSKWHVAGWHQHKKEFVFFEMTSIQEVKLSNEPFKRMECQYEQNAINRLR